MVSYRQDHQGQEQSLAQERSEAAAATLGALAARETARKIVSYLRRLRFVGHISKTQLALLVPRGIALAELNLDRQSPLTAADLTRALKELHIADYPQREAPMSGSLQQAEPIQPPALNASDCPAIRHPNIGAR